MATIPTFLRVGYLDSAERISEVRYRMATPIEDDGANVADVLAAADDLQTALNVLTWDHIQYAFIEFDVVGASASANVAANNQVFAFHRTTLSDGSYSYFEVPAWDDATFDQDNNNLLSPAYVLAAGAVADLTLDPDTGLTWDVNFAQSRARKSRKKQLG